jgi:polyisoprenoid-binding protein YceI
MNHKEREDMTRMLPAYLAVATFATSPSFAADTWASDKGHSEASFTIRHLVSKVSGRFDDFSTSISVDPAKPEASTVEFVVKSASIDTRNPDRDKHLKSPDFFDVEKYPEITFKSTRITSAAKDRYDVTGNLTIHGVTREVTLPVAFLGFAKDPWGNERSGFEISTTLNRKDYGLLWNKTLDTGGYLLGDDVAVSINLEAVKKKPAAAN